MNLLCILIAFTLTVSSKCCMFPGKMLHIFSLYIFRLISFDAVASPCPLNCVFPIKKIDLLHSGFYCLEVTGGMELLPNDPYRDSDILRVLLGYT